MASFTVMILILGISGSTFGRILYVDESNITPTDDRDEVIPTDNIVDKVKSNMNTEDTDSLEEHMRRIIAEFDEIAGDSNPGEGEDIEAPLVVKESNTTATDDRDEVIPTDNIVDGVKSNRNTEDSAPSEFLRVLSENFNSGERDDIKEIEEKPRSIPKLENQIRIFDMSTAGCKQAIFDLRRFQRAEHADKHLEYDVVKEVERVLLNINTDDREKAHRLLNTKTNNRAVIIIAAGSPADSNSGVMNTPAAVSYQSMQRYKLIEEKVNFFKAINICSQFGMRLATFSNEEEFNQLTQYLKISNSNETMGFWVGATDLGERNKYTWLFTGKELAFTKWHRTKYNTQEPNHGIYFGEEERCVDIRADFNYEMNDNRCSTQQHFVCEDLTQLSGVQAFVPLPFY